MSLLPIIGIILLGLILIGVEILFVPGTTVVGFLGFFTILSGIYFTFQNYGNLAGWIIVISVSLILGISTYLAIQKKVWKKYSLQKEISGKVDNNKASLLEIGQEGKAVSALRPSGTAEFNDVRFEVSTSSTFVDAGSKVKIISINKKRVTVETV